MNYANEVAEEAYGKYEDVGKMPVGVRSRQRQLRC